MTDWLFAGAVTVGLLWISYKQIFGTLEWRLKRWEGVGAEPE